MSLKINIILLICAAFFYSCSSGDIEIEILEKVSSTGSVLNKDIFLASGFKINKEYNVSYLPKAKSAIYGWKNVGVEETKDFEIILKSLPKFRTQEVTVWECWGIMSFLSFGLF